MRDKAVGNGNQARGVFARCGGVVEQRKAFHLHGKAALFVAQLFPVIGRGVAIEHIAGMDHALDHCNALPCRAFAQRSTQGGRGPRYIARKAVLRFGIAALAVGAGGQNHIEYLCFWAVRAGRADADDVFHTVLRVQLPRIDADGGHAHAAAHHRYRRTLIGARIAQHAPYIRYEPRVLQKRLGNELCAQRVARHQHGFGKIPLVGGVVRC